jgi:multidrug efflux pump subunit AcrA (membrane-fusion protein)
MLVDTTTVDVARSYPSQVYVEHDVAVAARSAGVLDSLLVNLGSHVRAGATLAVVDSRAQQIEAAHAGACKEWQHHAHRLGGCGG